MAIKNDRELFDRIHKGAIEGVQKAIREHKNAGHSISVWEDGMVIEIPAEEIIVAE